jgi:hypothetical protein
MVQTQSRTADFAGVLPSRVISKPGNTAAVKTATNSIQPLQEHQTPSDAGLTLPAVTQLDQLPVHCIAREGIGGSVISPVPLVPERSSDDGCGILTARPPSSLYAEPESVRKARVLDEHADICSEILEGFLFVSNLRVAKDRATLDALGITHVIDCCAELSGVDTDEDDERVRLRLALRDDTREDLSPFLLFQLVPFIAQCRQEQRQRHGAGPKVLIHCHQGVSRSCAVAISFVMVDRSMAFRDAMTFVKQRRAISSPNAAFLCHLIQWGRDLDGFLTSSSDPRVLNGLFRLAPHASHDQRTLLLKRCGDVDDRWTDESNVAAELWSKGVFVFQRPGDATVVIWIGARCCIEDGALVARRLVESAVRAKSFAVIQAKSATMVATSSDGDVSMQIVDVRGPEGSEGDLFEYATELQWYLDDVVAKKQRAISTDAPQDTPSTHDEGQTNCHGAKGDSESPLLFVLESLGSDELAEGFDGAWERLEQYDAEDLTPQDAFLLIQPSPSAPSAAVSSTPHHPHRLECFAWIGANCLLDIQRIMNASRHHVDKLFPLSGIAGGGSSSVHIAIERQSSESDRFWHVFELGY